MIASNTRTYQTVAGAAALVIGPLLMSIGDLIHPDEDLDAAEQASIIVDHASRWYAGHLLLLVGMLVLVPGLLALTNFAAERRPASRYVSRVLLLAGSGVFSGVFMTEMLIGRYVSDGADATAAAELLGAFQSGPMLVALMLGVIAFFTGVGVFTVPLIVDGGWPRWPAVIYATGAALIFAEIMSAQVLLSQIGNILLLVASVLFAWRIVQPDDSSALEA